MEAVVSFTPETKNATLTTGKKERIKRRKKALSSLGFSFRKKGKIAIDARTNLKNEKVKGGIFTKPILVTGDTAPLMVAQSIIIKIAFVLLLIS